MLFENKPSHYKWLELSERIIIKNNKVPKLVI